MKFRPDFSRFRNAILGQDHDAVPYAEFGIHRSFWPTLIKEDFPTTGTLVERIQSVIQFRLACGCDYLCSDGLWGFDMPYPNLQGVSYSTVGGQVRSFEDLDKLVWTRRSGNLETLDTIQELLPEGMQVIADCHQIFDSLWLWMGWEGFAIALLEQPELVQEFFDRQLLHVLQQLKEVVDHPTIGAIWLCDDLAYTEGLMCSPHFFRTMVFPGYRKIADLAAEKDLPLLLHSDGDLTDILDDLLDMGFQGIHPFEPKAMDIFQCKEDYGDRLCAIGNVDVDVICRGTPEDTASLTAELLDRMAAYNGFCLSSSNTIPNYARAENFVAMLQTLFAFNGWA